MKAGEFLKFLDEFLNLNSKGLKELSEYGALQEVEVEDSIKDNLDEKMKAFITLEAAKNNPDLDKFYKNKHYSTIKGELLGNVDSSLISFAKEFLNEDEVSMMEEADFTKDKLKVFQDGFKRVISEKSNDEDHKKLIESLKKQISQAEKEKTEFIKESQRQLEDKTKDFNNKLIRKEFNRFIDENYTLADAYKKPVVKNGIYNSLFEEANKKAKFVLDEEANILLRNPENPEMAYYIDGSKEGTLNHLVDPAIKDFLKKSEAKEDKRPQEQHFQNEVNLDNLNPMYADRLRRAQEAENGF